MDNRKTVNGYTLLVAHTALLLVPYVPVYGEGISADPMAAQNQQPVILNTANGTPQINIQTPNSHGVSRNQYRSFNVDSRGAILNNSAAATSTQIGGWIEANPHLAGKGARIILNEVNSSDPSFFNGHIEVAGRRAQVVIANPSGISCDGCGFINASRSTLTTGRPEFHNGTLAGFHVSDGEITFTGQGLDDSQSDFTDIIARSIKMNASIWANDLALTTGINHVSAKNELIRSQQTGAAKPQYSVDVAALGGMYAGKIRLVGTEEGVGVKNAGHIGAGVGEFRIDINGKLHNLGQLESEHSMMVQSQQIDNAAGANIAAQQLNLQTQTLKNNGLVDGETIGITSSELNNLSQGRIYGDGITLIANAITNQADTETDAPVIAAREQLTIKTNELINGQGATLFSQGDLSISELDNTSPSTLVNNGGLIEAGNNLSVAVSELHNFNPDLVTQWVIDSKVRIREIQPEGWSRKYDIRYFPTIDNHYVELQSYVDDNGRVRHFEDYTYYDYTATTRSTHVVSSVPAKIIAGHDLTIDGNVENRDSQIIAGNELTLTGGTLLNVATPGIQEVSFNGIRQFRDWEGNDEELDFYAKVPYNPATKTREFNLGTTQMKGEQNSVGDFNQDSIPVNISSWFQQVANPDKNYVIEVDPQFADYKTWLGSDYMLQRLSYDPALAHKRLGDGFVEQSIIRDQIIQLTGQRYLPGYADDEKQYLELMNAGVSIAEQWQLVPGIALSSEQMAVLTSDIIWLVSQDMIMDDGTVMSTLVPKVYLKPASADMNPEVGLLAGNEVNIKLDNDITNSATILGREQISIDSKQINLTGGQVKGKVVTATAENINIKGGVAIAEKALDFHADKNISINSVTATSANSVGKSSFKRENIRRVAGVYVTGMDGQLDISANQDIKLNAAVIQNTGDDGKVRIQAGRDLLLGTVNESETNHSIHSDKDFNRMSRTDAVGTRIVSQGNVQLDAGNTLEMAGAEVTAAKGHLGVQAEHIDIKQAENSYQSDIGSYTTHSGTFSSNSKQQRDTFEQVTASNSLLSAKSLSIESAKELNITGSNVVADNDVLLTAGEDINIAAAQNTFEESHFVAVKKSGIYSGGGIGFTIGSQQLATTDDTQRINTVASKVGSLSGDVNIAAGQNYHQTASDVVALQGNVDIKAQKVGIVSAAEQRTRKQAMEYSQSGLTIELTSPVIQAATTVKNITDSASDTLDPRMKLLAAGTSALTVKNAYDNFIDTQAAGGYGSEVGGVNLSISIGASKSSNEQTQTNMQSAGSKVLAGNSVTIEAKDAEDNSDITVMGSTVQASGDVSLTAEDDINLVAAANRNRMSSENQSSGGSIGFSIGTDGLLFNVGASKGQGEGRGEGTSWNETYVTAGEDATVQLISGSDTTLKGAVVSGGNVIANVGGDLDMQSLQDRDQYESEQKNMGVSISVGYGKVGGSFSLSETDIESDYASVKEQTAIKAGDKGFQINVAGNTSLTGAAIASTQTAIDNNLNSLTTGTLEVSDIENRAEYDASGYAVTVAKGPQKKLELSGAGIGKDEGDAQTTTLSGISHADISITDNEVQQAMTGNTEQQTIAALKDDIYVNGSGEIVDETGAINRSLTPIFDAEKVAKEINAQVQITQEAAKQSYSAVGRYVEEKQDYLRGLQQRAKTEEEKQQIEKQLDDLLLTQQALNILIGAVTGNAGMAITKEGLLSAAAKMRKITIENSMLFAGVVDPETGLVINNMSGESEGIRGDGVKVGGARIDLEKLCAEGRCELNEDGSIMRDGQNRMIWNNTEGNGSLQDFLETDEGKAMRGVTGGIQGWDGTLFGIPYTRGSWQDQLIEAFAGTHDVVGGQVSGLYDKEGNAALDRSEAVEKIHDTWSAIAVLPSTPFALSELLSAEVWQAISIFASGAN